jgi:hypothetical protein
VASHLRATSSSVAASCRASACAPSCVHGARGSNIGARASDIFARARCTAGGAGDMGACARCTTARAVRKGASVPRVGVARPIRQAGVRCTVGRLVSRVGCVRLLNDATDACDGGTKRTVRFAESKAQRDDARSRKRFEERARDDGEGPLGRPLSRLCSSTHPLTIRRFRQRWRTRSAWASSAVDPTGRGRATRSRGAARPRASSYRRSHRR